MYPRSTYLCIHRVEELYLALIRYLPTLQVVINYIDLIALRYQLETSWDLYQALTYFFHLFSPDRHSASAYLIYIYACNDLFFLSPGFYNKSGNYRYDNGDAAFFFSNSDILSQGGFGTLTQIGLVALVGLGIRSLHVLSRVCHYRY